MNCEDTKEVPGHSICRIRQGVKEKLRWTLRILIQVEERSDFRKKKKKSKIYDLMDYNTHESKARPKTNLDNSELRDITLLYISPSTVSYCFPVILLKYSLSRVAKKIFLKIKLISQYLALKAPMP